MPRDAMEKLSEKLEKQLPTIKATIDKATQAKAQKAADANNGSVVAGPNSVPPFVPTPLQVILYGPMSAPDTIFELLSKLLREKYASASVPEMRAALHKIKYALSRELSPQRMGSLLRALEQKGYKPPWCQLRSQFAGGNPFSAGISDDDPSPLLEDAWDERYAPEKLLGLLLRGEFAEFHRRKAHVLPVVDDLLARLPKGRPSDRPEREFIEGLARMWSSFGFPLSLGRGSSAGPGAFADFVETALRAYPFKKDEKLRVIPVKPGVVREVVESLKLPQPK